MFQKTRYVTLFTLLSWATLCAGIPTVPQGHPRVYLLPSDVVDIQSKIALPEFQAIWQQVSNSSHPAAMALTYLITADATKGRLAVDQALADVQSSSAFSRWYDPVHYAACVYDWCYDLLTEAEKQAFVNEFQRIAGLTQAGYPAGGNIAPIGSGAEEGCILTAQLPAGLAIYDEVPEMFDAAAQMFLESFKPARDYYYPGHAHPQGDSYINRLVYDMFASWLFRRMGEGNVLSVEQQYVPYAIIYNRRPDYRQMRRGDTFDLVGHYGDKRLLSMLTGTYYEDPYLMQMADEEISASFNDLSEVFHLIFRKPGLAKSPISQLPLTKYFAEPIGEMVMRTGWNMGWPSNDAMIFMRLGGTYFHGHQHRDMGTFQIYYKGPLATVSGVYQSGDTGAGSEHWEDYYHQTLSHNGLLIFDPNEAVQPTYHKVNDGGQRMPNNGFYPRSYNLDSLYKLGEVKSRDFGPDANDPDYGYLSGNITNAYTEKVSLVTRSMVAMNLRDSTYPAALITFDRIKSTRPEFKKTWLLHSHQEPLIDGKTITIVNNQSFNMFDGAWSEQNWSGKVVAESLLPHDAEIVSIGGPGYEFWVESVRRNYAVSWYENDEPGAWRVEVSPSSQQTWDNFLHVMTVMDQTTAHGPDVELIENDKIAGIMLLNRAVIFSKSDEMLDAVSFPLPSDGITHVLVCDLKPGPWTVRRGDDVIFRADVGEDENVLYFQTDTAEEGTSAIYNLEYGTYHSEVAKVDFNLDFKIDFFDLAFMLNQWLNSPPLPHPETQKTPDPVADGRVDFQDFAFLALYWLYAPQPVTYELVADPATREVYSSSVVVERIDSKWHLDWTDPDTGINSDGVLVMAFRLPEKPFGTEVKNANLMFYVGYDRQTGYSIDLYALPVVSACTPQEQVVSPDNWYQGAWDMDAGATAIQQEILDISWPKYIWQQTNEPGRANLAGYLRQIYDNGAMPGDYLLLRMNSSEKYAWYVNHEIGSIYEYRDGQWLFSNEHAPRLTLEFCPEVEMD